MNCFSVSKVLGLCLGLAFLTACDKKDEEAPSIASIAVANPDFQVLEDAAIRGDVAIVLSNKNPNDAAGNYTVFAPTNAAFARLGLVQAADLDALQKPFLTNTLLYHVAGGLLPGSSLQPGGSSASAFPTGQTRRYVKRGNGLYVNGSKILATDVKAANGVVHVVDKVLLATGDNIVESAIALKSGGVFVKPELTFLVEAVVYADLATTLSGPGPFTVFAPTDQAFKELGVLLNTPLEVPADIRKLPQATVQAVLLNHTLVGDQFTSELPENASLSTAGGTTLSSGAFNNGVLTIKGASNTVPANMVIPDVQCTNGIVHVIDRVLLP